MQNTEIHTKAGQKCGLCWPSPGSLLQVYIQGSKEIRLIADNDVNDDVNLQ